jgi:Leucine-rich repeat (LRR) protein
MKKTLLSILFTISIVVLNAQTTAIPDANFEQVLINAGYDFGSINGSVLTANINTIDSLYIPQNTGTTDLSGIEDFSALRALYCFQNSINILDLSQNSNLEYLQCSNNQLTTLNITQNPLLATLFCNDNFLDSLDLSFNPNLVHLVCEVNQITNLNLSQNPLLTILACGYNQLSELQLTQNPLLDDLSCLNNQLTCLNIKNGNNSNFTWLLTVQNPNLTCIEVDNIILAQSMNSWNIDPQTSYSTSCGNACSTVGIYENKLLNISLHPNPTSGNINIDLVNVEKTIKTTLTNSLGQVILTQFHESTDHFDVNIDGPSGIYFLNLECEGVFKTFKVLKE